MVWSRSSTPGHSSSTVCQNPMSPKESHFSGPSWDLPWERTRRMPWLNRERLAFYYESLGEGLPFCFQHGLGGDVNQPFGLYTPPAGIRLLSFDMRAHGQTRPVGDVTLLSVATFADDLVALLDDLGAERAVIGGISLGAAVAANVAIRY